MSASHVDFLDVNPRAVAFQIDNANRNGLARMHFYARCESKLDAIVLLVVAIRVKG